MNWRGIAFAALFLGTTACHRGSRVAAPPPAPIPAPVSAPAVAVMPPALRDGESAYNNGDFVRAARSYDEYLQSRPQASDMDRILFRLAVAQSMSGVPASAAAGNETFNQLIRDFPQSPYVPPARVILSLRADIVRLQADQKTRDDKIKQLNDELDKLKKIDLDRRRTP
jgi:hypothetical protein